MIRQTVQVNSKIVSFWTNEARSDNILLILHGFRGNHKGLAEFARTLTEQKVILLDLPGYGDSQCLDGVHDLNAYAHFLRDFCQTMALDRVTVIGHSFGASITIIFASLYPHQAAQLILIAPVTDAHTFEALLGKAYYGIAFLLPSFLRSRWIKSSILDNIAYRILLKTSLSPRYQQLILASHQNLKDLNEKVVIENFLGFYSAKLYDCGQKIAAPTLIIVGDADKISPMTSMEKLRQSISGAEIKMIPKAGHLVPLEEPDTVSQLVKDFLN